MFSRFLGNHETFVPVQALYVHDRFRSQHHDNNLALLELAGPLPFGPALIQLCLPTKDFSENVLMHSGRTGVLKDTGAERNQDLVYMTLEECRSQMNFSHPLSNKMFCMRRQDGAETGNQNHVGGRPASGHQNKNLRSHHRDHKALGNQNLVQRRQNQTQTSGVQFNRTENHNSSSPEGAGRPRTGVGASQCGDPLPGAPVATVEQGTAFLTGLMMSSGCDDRGGLAFTKLSRYLSWIRPRLEAAEGHMTPQAREYPETL